MKIKLKWLTVTACAVVVCGTSIVSTAAASGSPETVTATSASDIALTLNGKPWQPKDSNNQPVYPLIVDGTSYLPVKDLAEGLGIHISWDNATRTIVIGGEPAHSDADANPEAGTQPDTQSDTPTVAISEAAAAAAAAAHVDLTKLPIGDGKYTEDGPKTGYVYLKNPPTGGRGASTDGPWIDKADGTFDITKKAVVDGSVNWNSELTVTVQGDKRIITGNRLPDSPTGEFPISKTDDAYQYDHNPNSIKEEMFKLVVPANPVVADKPSPVTAGAIGVMLSGALLFDALDEEGRDAVAHETQDGCYGHPQGTGIYHFHNLSVCADDPYTGGHSQLLGYALDGFGIYGKYGEDGKLLTDADLDANHGHYGWVDWDGKSVYMYHYHATYEFPYTIGAFAGTPSALEMSDASVARAGDKPGIGQAGNQAGGLTGPPKGRPEGQGPAGQGPAGKAPAGK